jgi:acyl-coenzyme A thioesterase PaaI-like protein
MIDEGELHEIDLNDFVEYHRSFLSRCAGEDGMKVRYFATEEGDLLAKVHFGTGSMGPPGHAHGGAMAAALDEAMGIACYFKMLPVLTSTLTIRYVRMLPLGTEAHLTATVEEGEGRDVIVKGRLFDPETGSDFTTAEGVYRRVKLDKIGDHARSVLERLGM